MAQEGFLIGVACLLVGSGANTGFFFEARDTTLENAQHLLHGIVLTLVFSLHGVERRFMSACMRSKRRFMCSFMVSSRPLTWLNMVTMATNKPTNNTLLLTVFQSKVSPALSRVRSRAAVPMPPGQRYANPMQAALFAEMIITAGGQGFLASVRVAERHAGTGEDGADTG